MLSNREIEHIKAKLMNNSSRNLRRKLKKKLIEHEYASKYQPFNPLPHHLQFINRTTSEEKLHQMIQVANVSTMFFLDTESTLIYHERNRPALIQLQLCPSNEIPTVLIIETNHLPSINSKEFQLIKQIFRIVLKSNNYMYTWGNIEELNDFVQFDLFDNNQIIESHNINLQHRFKGFWQRYYPHGMMNECICETCIGKTTTESWSLQGAVAYFLNEWLDKRHTCTGFDIGLDPELDRWNDEQLEHRIILTTYAAYDCLAMQKILIQMNEISSLVQSNDNRTIHSEQQLQSEAPNLFSSLNNTIHHVNIGTQAKQNDFVFLLEKQQWHDDQHFKNESSNQSLEVQESSEHPIERQYIFNHHHRREQHRSESFDEQNPQLQSFHEQENKEEIDKEGKRQTLSTEHQNRSDNHSSSLNARQYRTVEASEQNHTQMKIDIEKKKQRNRMCTIKQRTRNYRHEIMRRNIDRRFSISIVKEILRRYGIIHIALNISKSQVTGKHSLYIGVRDKSLLKEYEFRTRTLFTTDHYNEFCARHHIRRSRFKRTNKIR